MKHTVDCIVRYQGGVVLVERSKEPLGLALPGGHVEENETLEQAVEREIREETNLRLARLRQFHTYSEPERDPRGRVISTVFTADGYGTLKAGDDAKHARIVPLDSFDALADKFAFDHYKILADYRNESTHHVGVAVAPSRAGTYYVAYKRDQPTERNRKYPAHRLLFDCMKTFSTYENAQAFAEENLPAVMAKKLPASVEEITHARDAKHPYVVIAEFYGKYSSTCMGETDPMTTYDVIRCSQQELASVVDEVACEPHFKKLWRGLEVKL